MFLLDDYPKFCSRTHLHTNLSPNSFIFVTKTVSEFCLATLFVSFVIISDFSLFYHSFLIIFKILRFKKKLVFISFFYVLKIATDVLTASTYSKANTSRYAMNKIVKMKNAIWTTVVYRVRTVFNSYYAHRTSFVNWRRIAFNWI